MRQIKQTNHNDILTAPLSVMVGFTLLLRGTFLLFITVSTISLLACTTETEDGEKENLAEEVVNTSGDDGLNNKENSPLTPGALPTNGNSSTGNTTSANGTGTPNPLPPVTNNETPLPDLSVTDYVVVSSRRTGRTRTEYTLKIKVSNSSSTTYENVLATLVIFPKHIVAIDHVVNIANIPPHSTIVSSDTFVIDVDLAVSTSFESLSWNFEGDVVAPPPPPPTGRPASAGYFMNIDNNQIPGESNSSSHEDWIELTAFTEGLHRDNTGTTGTTRRRSSFVFDGVNVSKLLDRSSPKIRQALAEGRFFGEVKIDIIAPCGGSLYTAYAITLSTAQIINLTMSGSEERPVENVGFIYTRIETMYTPVAKDCTLLTPVFSTQDGEMLRL
jgi:type VI secretion system secreted protein Hcp